MRASMSRRSVSSVAVAITAIASFATASVLAASPVAAATHRSVQPSTSPVADGTRFHESGGSTEYVSWFGASLPLSSTDARDYSAEGNKAVATVASGYVSTHPASDFPAHTLFRVVGSVAEFVDDGQEILGFAGGTGSCLTNLGQAHIAVVPEQWAKTLTIGPGTTCARPGSVGPFSLVQRYTPPTPDFFPDSPLTGDFNGDGRADEFVYGEGTDTDQLWYGTANGFVLGPQVTVNGEYEPVVGDFNGDGKDDILWYAGSEGFESPRSFTTSMWLGVGGTSGFVQAANVPAAPGGTHLPIPFPGGGIELLAGANYVPLVADFNGDGKADVYWSLESDIVKSGTPLPPNQLWYGAVNGFAVGSKSASPMPPDKHTLHFFPSPGSTAYVRVDFREPPIVGDYDGDGAADLLWYLPGTTYLWRGHHGTAAFTGAHVTIVRGDYEPIEGDFNGDGKADVLWYGVGNLHDSLWRGTTNGFSGGPSVDVKGDYLPFTGDFNGDGKADVYWHSFGNSDDHTWYGRSSGFTSGPDSIESTTDDGLVQPTVGDFNGDGHDDVLWWRDDVVETPRTFSETVSADLWHAH
jgi:hypothetical protein